VGSIKNGNHIIPIRWDKSPDSDWGKPQPATGIIVIKENFPDFIDEIESILRSGSE